MKKIILFGMMLILCSYANAFTMVFNDTFTRADNTSTGNWEYPATTAHTFYTTIFNITNNALIKAQTSDEGMSNDVTAVWDNKSTVGFSYRWDNNGAAGSNFKIEGGSSAGNDEACGVGVENGIFKANPTYGTEGNTEFILANNTWYYMVAELDFNLDKVVNIRIRNESIVNWLNFNNSGDGWGCVPGQSANRLRISGGANYKGQEADNIVYYIGGWDEYDWNKLFSPNPAPSFSNINCTSSGDSTSPYTTADTTPTFTFETDILAYCAIADENLSYTAMGQSRNCTSGDGSKIHTCTLLPGDELIYSTDYVYISCVNSYNLLAGNTTVLQMEITNLPVNHSLYIERGIQNSFIWPGATLYSNQQVYLRNLNNSQTLATVDWVAVYGSQRWLLNVGEEDDTLLGLFNISPIVYVFDRVNMSLTNIEYEVAALINSTKT